MGVRVSLPGLHLLGTGGGWFVGVVGSSVMARGLHICAKSGVSLLGRTGSMGRFAHGDCRIAGGSELQRMGYRQGVSSTLGLLLVATALPRARRARQPSRAPSRPMFPPPSSPIYSLHHGKGCGSEVVLSPGTFHHRSESELGDGVPPGSGQAGGRGGGSGLSRA